MGLFHVKKGTPVAKDLPNKSKLKDSKGICMNFCAHEMKCNFPQTRSVRMVNITQTGRMSLTKTNSCFCHTWIALAYYGLTRKL
jgi:hypothetical protein